MADPDNGRRLVEALMFGSGTVRRFTQDSPVLPDVWIKYFNARSKREQRIELLLTPDRDSTTGELARELRQRLDAATPHGIAYNASTVVVTLRFDELVRVVLPLTKWWWDNMERGQQLLAQLAEDEKARELLAKALVDPDRYARELEVTAALLWMVRVVGMLAMRFYSPAKKLGAVPRRAAEWRPPIEALARLLRDLKLEEEPGARIFSVSLNRPARVSLDRSALAIKADAARQLFSIHCDKLTWAVVDSGIDAEHPAFRIDGARDGEPFDPADKKRPNRTRVVATYDFSRVRLFLDPDLLTKERLKELYPPSKERSKNVAQPLPIDELRTRLEDLKKHLLEGRSVDWALLMPLLEVPHDAKRYRPPIHDHGTHVAGILGADWQKKTDGETKPRVVLQGICPDIRFYDLRVLDEDGNGDEFSVIAALQFIRYLNAHHDYMVLQGANLSLSLLHDVANYACGRTPVCEECDRLAGAGVVVVAAAGNNGYERVQTAEGLREGYHSVSITDPGNAESVITVGATHRYKPHTYGVSYFSSRGPTGDGRIKPDLVAPGEKINAPVPGEGQRAKDGTSMAAPHVSGAAALLMARYNELIGEPARIKEILKSTATDLGRERYFQGEGMLDVLRALQAV
ncbi:MAG TPA: S8 family serine peptidase [Thermoanaerobaculia bacterium]|jgi:hypothetical protein|nr:S8 family serine peptidase [Thermoanaerobaculia bacterium]